MRFWLPGILQDFQMSGNSACIWPYPQLRSLSLPYCLETDLLLELYISPDFACLWDSLDKFDPLGEVDMGSTTQRQGMRVDKVNRILYKIIKWQRGVVLFSLPHLFKRKTVRLRLVVKESSSRADRWEKGWATTELYSNQLFNQCGG